MAPGQHVSFNEGGSDMADIDYSDYLFEGLSAFAQNDFDRSITLISKALDETPENKVAIVSRGAAFLQCSRVAEAIADFDRAIEIDAAYARAYHLRGLAREKEGNDKAALDNFDKALSINPDYGAAYKSRASLYYMMNNEDNGLEDVMMAAYLTHRNIESFSNEHNIWRSLHLRVEDMEESDLNR
jgi:tetratricopeptide (TPR) repeat protein